MDKKEIWVEDEKIAKEAGVLCGKAEPLVKIASFADLKGIEKLEAKGVERIFLECANWKVIPLENAIAMSKKAKLIAVVNGIDEARVAMQTLEKGVAGVFMKNVSGKELLALKDYLKETESVRVVEAEVSAVKKVGILGRSCIDTGEVMNADEGMAIGNSAGAFVLMQAEVSENPHVNTRPFRVNAGAISLYTLLPEDKTRYLNEVKAGDEVLIVNRKGGTRKAVVVRNKIEWRPMVLIEAKSEGKEIKTIAQDAETVKVMAPKGAVGISMLKEGDKILCVLGEGGARHFGMRVEERVIEQ
ncbi:3-dehydroquinate synthase II [Candidatus Micrarchaeota archaeon CG11_big_fil_rev_8_21_14_0_20_47_5]|nr:MAG: hypothetical protein AUJ17_00070 [Candidatus Micrarchaeota archaeon CG1_02_47_40]PIN83970.1 MAG: 3-dehydroquinate synthase II [Candidatus Micrarchaeota archaeon CG11_big_fil_rev_8_21_14_0_20_47_5]